MTTAATGDDDLVHHRGVAFTYARVDGGYRYRDSFQILPPPEGWPRPNAIHAHNPFIIEYAFPRPPVEYLGSHFGEQAGEEIQDWVTLIKYSKRKLTEILRLLTLFTWERYEVYGHRQSWFISVDGDVPDGIPRWGQESYWPQGMEQNAESLANYNGPELKVVSGNDYFATPYTSPYFGTNGLVLPSDLGSLFDITASLVGQTREAFLKASSLFQLAIKLRIQSKSLSLVALVSAIETLVEYEHSGQPVDRCRNCGQLAYSSTRKFKDFVFSKFTGNLDNKLLNELYSIRSGIVHKGALFLSDLALDDIHIEREEWERDWKFRAMIDITRLCLINWLLEQPLGSQNE